MKNAAQAPDADRKVRLTRPIAALFTAEVISTTGSEMAAVALPWFVLVTTGSAARMGFVMAAEFLGMAVLGIPSGRAATAVGPRRTLLVSDLSRAGLVGLIPLLHWMGVLTFPVLVAVGFAVGAFFPAYSSSQQIVIASLLGDDEVRMTRLGGLFGSVNETASFIGPAIGGLLIALIGAASVLVVDSATFLVAFVLVAALVPRIPKPAPDEGGRGAMEGVRWIWRNRPLRWRVAGLAVVELGFTALVATLPFAALHRYGGSVGVAGWLLAAYGAGSVLGGVLTFRRSAGERTALAGAAGLAVSAWPLVFVLPAWGVGLAVGANGIASELVFPWFFSSVTIRTPQHLRARVAASVNTLVSATGPIGFVAAGLLLHVTGSATAGFVLVAAAMTVGAVVFAVGGRLSDATALPSSPAAAPASRPE